MATARVVLLGIGTAALVQSLRRLLIRWRQGDYGGLESLVSFSSRLIAAARAVESLRPDAFVVDPLAWILAGPQAMARYKDDPAVVQSGNATAGKHVPPTQESSQPAAAASGHREQQSQSQSQPQEQQQGDSERRPVPRLIMRTCFFDDAVLAAVGRPAARSLQCMAPLLRHVAHQQGLPHCTQVVLLGSGMDSRPWRLALPPGVAWFEVDRHDVLAAKQAELTKAGVSFTPCTDGSSNSTSYTAGSGSSSSSSSMCLKASSWSCASADLQLPGWSQKLVAAALDVHAPVAWLAEGLLYYLEPDCVPAMLQEAARISPPGSIFAANFLTDEGLQLLHSRAAAAARGRTTETPAGSTADISSGAAAEDTCKSAATNITSSSSAKPRGSGLMSQFKWGCPDDMQQFWCAQGWQLLQCHSWRQAAAAYGWQPQVNAAALDRPPTQEVQFALAVKAN